MTDDLLVDCLKKGDKSAMTVVYKKYWEPLYLKAFAMFNDSDTCEDVIQELFIDLWIKRNQLSINVSLKAYLFASMRYQIYRRIKEGTLSESIQDFVEQKLLTSSPEQILIQKELQDEIERVVESLSTKCRQVYRLSREEQLSHKEIASRLQISHKTVENHLRKALQILRTSLLNKPMAIEILILLFFSNQPE